MCRPARWRRSCRPWQAWQGLPIRFVGGVQVTGVTSGTDAAAALRVTLKDGAVVDADQVIAATGLRTAGRLAASAGLAFDSGAGGIVVSAASGATSVPGIHALGDCVVVDGQASRFIEPIARQARAIAAHLVQGQAPAAADAPPQPLLRVKTSALPITVTGRWQGPGSWHTELDRDGELRLQRRLPGGEVLATLVARRPAGAGG